MKTLRLTPQLIKALTDFCDEDMLEAHVRELDALEDFILMELDIRKPADALGSIVTLRETRKLLMGLLDAMEEEGDGSNG